ncbi:MAG: acetyl-CoA hydrolase/transferase family protein [Paludibacteraceae bacterium]|nr:acetyl-CoA hydrolase/transferase family protein [Paludibacteraceae bacterium]MBR4839206.1 acetyl-CoA hydrolase/transferase family protein [Paludibacteraceae bacterium]
MAFKIMTADEAARFVKNGDQVGFSGFTPSGTPKAVPAAIAKMAEEEHAKGNEFQIGIFSGASAGDALDGALARAKAVKFRTPYQSNKDMRNAINSQEVSYSDMHLSHLAQELRYGFYGDIDVAVIEAADLNEKGEILLTSGVGNVLTYANMAKKIIVELNRKHPVEIKGMHDLFEPANPPYRGAIPIYKVSDRGGAEVLKVDPSKIVAVVETNLGNSVAGFTPMDAVTAKIGQNVADFLASQLRLGIIPKEFLPIQSGVGNVANAVLGSLGENKEIPNFTMYTEVIQDSVIGLMKEGRISYASGCSLTVSDPVMDDIYGNLGFFKDKFVLRPIELSNNPEVIRRLGLITINTALEADIFGNVNSTHVLGTKMMNGIGGSGDFTRNAYISIYTCPSTQKDGKISPIVPMVSHVDHSEHSVNVLITEQGIADLRGKSPIERAKTIIENCVHPDYKQLLWDYLKLGKNLHTPHSLQCAFGMHLEFAKSADMRNTDWNNYLAR